MKACVEHAGAAAFGCANCMKASASQIEEAADDIYARGFRDGVKWVNAGVRAKMRELDRLMTRSEKRTATTHPKAKP